jgi:hypothetical protein
VKEPPHCKTAPSGGHSGSGMIANARFQARGERPSQPSTSLTDGAARRDHQLLAAGNETGHPGTQRPVRGVRARGEHLVYADHRA